MTNRLLRIGMFNIIGSVQSQPQRTKTRACARHDYFIILSKVYDKYVFPNA